MATEQQIQQQIRLDLGRHPDIRLFRNNTGTAWAGQAQRIARPTTVAVGPGDVVIRNARPLHAGLALGSSDLIGWRSTAIGPEHIGQRLAVFAALEIKSPKGRTTAEQEAFIAGVRRFGGIAGIARSSEEALSILA